MMRTCCTITILMSCLAVVAWAGPGGVGGGGAVPAAGLIQFDPPQPRGCVAVRLEVPADKMLVGVRWFNGASSTALPRLLVATGSGTTPPAYGEAIAAADSVVGVDHAWSEMSLAEPIASDSGSLFVIVEYPPLYAPPMEAPALGVGYAMEQTLYPYFVSGDGNTWIPVARACRVLLEPILASRTAEAVSLKSATHRDEPILVRAQGLRAAPNPFNPQSEIALYLNQASSGEVRIYDVRGRLVRELYRGPFVGGDNKFTWDGRDTSGRAVASGAYWVRATTTAETFTTKVMLLR